VIVFLAGRGGWWGKPPATKGLDWMEEPPNHDTERISVDIIYERMLINTIYNAVENVLLRYLLIGRF